MIHRNELVFSIASGIAALAAIVALPALVAKPKLLFGRSLSAIEPTLFPKIILTMILLLSVLAAVFALIGLRRKQKFSIQANSLVSAEVGTDDNETNNESGIAENPLFKVTVFFVVLVAYGLMLKPLGFLISSFIVITVVSLLLGNRNWFQIIPFALISPICLYLLATRVLLVSLPELNVIELFYAGIINRFGS